MVSLGFFQRVMSRFVPALVAELDRQQLAIAALTHAREEAERANKAKSEFLAKMSLELRTPLNAVVSYSETLLAGARRGKQAADIERIQAAGRQALGMVRDIADISRIEAGTMALHVEMVDLEWLIDELAEAAGPMAARNNNSFVLERGPELGGLQSDVARLRQSIFNLLSHAAETTRDGRIGLAVERRGDWLAFTVADTGSAIWPEQQMEPGLSLTRNLCRLLGGDLSIESEEGRGNRLTIMLPAPVEPSREVPEVAVVAEGDDDRVEAVADTPAEAEHHSDNRVLVVDDDENFLERAGQLLVQEGYVPVCTDAPQSALQLARSVGPDVIFLDILMPGFDGWDVLGALKADPATAEIPVIMIGIRSERARALAAGADGVVAKPLDAGRIKAAMAGLRVTRGMQRAAAGSR